MNGFTYEAFSPDASGAALQRFLDDPGLANGSPRGRPAVKTITQDAGEWEARYEALLGFARRCWRMSARTSTWRSLSRRSMAAGPRRTCSTPLPTGRTVSTSHWSPWIQDRRTASLDALRARGARILTVKAADFNHGDTRNDGTSVRRRRIRGAHCPRRVARLLALVGSARRASGRGPVACRDLGAPACLARMPAGLSGTRCRNGLAPRALRVPLDRLARPSSRPSRQASATRPARSTTSVRASGCRSGAGTLFLAPLRRRSSNGECRCSAQAIGWVSCRRPSSGIRTSDPSCTNCGGPTWHISGFDRFSSSPRCQRSALMRAICSSLPLHIGSQPVNASQRTRAVAHAVGLGVAWPLGQYLGNKSVRDGRELLRVRGV